MTDRATDSVISQSRFEIEANVAVCCEKIARCDMTWKIHFTKCK